MGVQIGWKGRECERLVAMLDERLINQDTIQLRLGFWISILATMEHQHIDDLCAHELNKQPYILK
jgi:hypothetical protein